MAPEDYLKRCEVSYFTTYADQAKQAGLALNRITVDFHAKLTRDFH